MSMFGRHIDVMRLFEACHQHLWHHTCMASYMHVQVVSIIYAHRWNEQVWQAGRRQSQCKPLKTCSCSSLTHAYVPRHAYVIVQHMRHTASAYPDRCNVSITYTIIYRVEYVILMYACTEIFIYLSIYCFVWQASVTPQASMRSLYASAPGRYTYTHTHIHIHTCICIRQVDI